MTLNQKSSIINVLEGVSKMTTIHEQVADALYQALEEMNSYINSYGEIQRSSSIIKGWHNYDNHQWELILAGAKNLSDTGRLDLPQYVEKDIEMLLRHLEEYSVHSDNLLYPTPAETKSLPGAITHANKAKYDTTIKTRTFRIMVNVREALCRALDIDLPNEDSSKGKLDPTPAENILEFN